jgi:hypothetical protein
MKFVKRTVFSSVSGAALALALIAAPAFSQGFEDAAAAGLARLGIQAPPIESLTTEQVAEITNVLNSTVADSDKRSQIELILGEEATATGRLGVGQLRSSTAAGMAALGMDTEVIDTLRLSQLAEIENVLSGSEADDVKRMRIEEIVGGEATATGRLGVSQLQSSAAADLAALGVDAEAVEMLTVSQLAQIENIMNSDMTDDEKRAQVQKIVGE